MKWGLTVPWGEPSNPTGCCLWTVNKVTSLRRPSSKGRSSVRGWSCAVRDFIRYIRYALFAEKNAKKCLFFVDSWQSPTNISNTLIACRTNIQLWSCLLKRHESLINLMRDLFRHEFLGLNQVPGALSSTAALYAYRLRIEILLSRKRHRPDTGLSLHSPLCLILNKVGVVCTSRNVDGLRSAGAGTALHNRCLRRAQSTNVTNVTFQEAE